MQFEKKVLLTPAWDRSDPVPSKNYGVHGVDLVFHLIGDRGGVSFALFKKLGVDAEHPRLNYLGAGSVFAYLDNTYGEEK